VLYGWRGEWGGRASAQRQPRCQPRPRLSTRRLSAASALRHEVREEPVGAGGEVGLVVCKPGGGAAGETGDEPIMRCRVDMPPVQAASVGCRGCGWSPPDAVVASGCQARGPLPRPRHSYLCRSIQSALWHAELQYSCRHALQRLYAGTSHPGQPHIRGSDGAATGRLGIARPRGRTALSGRAGRRAYRPAAAAGWLAGLLRLANALSPQRRLRETAHQVEEPRRGTAGQAWRV
jgi:hypothetical protein